MRNLAVFVLFILPVFAYGRQDALLEQLTIREGIRFFQEASQPFNGKASAYYPNGNKKLRIDFRDGRRHGAEVAWDESGRMKHRIYYRQGKLQSYGSAWFNGENKVTPVSRFQSCYNPKKPDAKCGDTEAGSRFEFIRTD